VKDGMSSDEERPETDAEALARHARDGYTREEVETIKAGVLALVPGASMYAEIAEKKQLAERLGIHDEALRLARTTLYSYSEWVDRLALAIAVGQSPEPDL
jgi:hypothetical protein